MKSKNTYIAAGGRRYWCRDILQEFNWVRILLCTNLSSLLIDNGVSPSFELVSFPFVHSYLQRKIFQSKMHPFSIRQLILSSQKQNCLFVQSHEQAVCLRAP